jgi:hypothetical protein
LHPKPSPIQGSLKDIFTDTFKELVKVVEAVTYAVGGIVSGKRNTVIRIVYNERKKIIDSFSLFLLSSRR